VTAALPREGASRTLRRLLANGRLTGLPKRPADQELLAALAAARFEAGTTYSEAQVNEQLIAWLETISEPFGIDHVTLRRMLVDSRLLVRTSTGSTYRLNEARRGELEGLERVDPTALLAEIADERDRRKARHSTGPAEGGI
jgi:hypothetical protein